MGINPMMKKMMKINTDILNFIKVFIFLDIALLIYSFIFQGKIWALNTQVAFFSSLFISIATFLSYGKNVNKQVENYPVEDNLNEQRDDIDKIDDPYDFYSPDVEQSNEELSSTEIKEIIKEEKSKIKKNSLKNTILGARGFLSLYRMFAYGILIFGFFALNNNKLFIPLAFIVGLSVVPIGVLLSKLQKNK